MKIDKVYLIVDKSVSAYTNVSIFTDKAEALRFKTSDPEKTEFHELDMFRVYAFMKYTGILTPDEPAAPAEFFKSVM